MSKLNIWLIQTGEPLPMEDNIRKMRTAILADKLVERGHNVLWWASAFDHFKKDWVFKKDTEIEVKDRLKVKALKGIGYGKNISLFRFIDHRIIAWKFRKIAPRMPKPDIIVVSMPPHDLAYQAVMFAKRYDIPVLVDIRDPWPDIFLNHIPKALREIARKLFFIDFQMIRKTMQMADGLIAVTKTFLEWGLRYAGREKTFKDKVFYLGYKKSLICNDSNKISKIAEKLKKKFVVTFVGTFATYHNPSVLLKCAQYLTETDIYFVLAGDGESFKNLNAETSNMRNLILTGWLDQDEIFTLLHYSHIGICPTPQNIDLFPNKAFAYLSASIPVISAFQGDLKEIIERYEIGFYYTPNDVDALVSCIKRLYEDKDLYAKMSANAKKVFDEMGNADKIYDEYATHIEMVANDYKQKI